jgi:putative membrane protein
MLKDDLSQPQRQALLGVFVLYVKNIRMGINFFLALIFPLIAGWNTGKNYVYVALALALIGVGVLAWQQYRNFFFRVVGDKFIINQGVFKKEELSVPFARIQSVHLKQNLIQQVLNVVGVEIETAGSVTKEVSIPALKRSYAEALKQFLLSRKAEVEPVETDGNEGQTDGDVKPKKDTEEQVILRLGIVDLLKVGLTENHLRTGLIAFGVLFSYFNQAEEFLAEEVDAATRQVETVVNTMVFIIPLSIFIFVVLSILLSTIRTVLRYYNLSVLISPNSLTVRGGLIKIQENLVPEGKIQFISWRSNPLRRLIGYQSLAIYQAGSEVVNRKNSVQVPGCREEQIEAVNEAFFPELLGFSALSTLKPVAYFQVRLLFFFGIIPATALAVLGWFEGWWWYIVAGLVVASADFFTRKYVARFQAQFSQDLLVLQRGFVYPQRILLKLYKVQNIALNQSIFQKRRGLASVILYTAGGKISIPFIPEAAAKSVVDFLLYKIESNRKEWM